MAGSLVLGGVMVPRHAFPRGSSLGPTLKGSGFVDTGYLCRVDADGHLILDGPPPGLVSVGGYRFVLKDLHSIVGAAGEDGTLALLPDTLLGYRLAGIAHSRERVHAALAARGANALIVGAFGGKSSESASAA
jgi:hypothetical protein